MGDVIGFLSETGLPVQVLAVLGSVAAWLVAKFYKTQIHETLKESFAGEVYEVVLQGAHATYQSLYKDLKARVSDGELSRKDIEALSERAYREALAAAQDPKVKTAIRDMTDHAWELLLKRAVNELKADGGSAAATTLPAVLESSPGK